MSQEIARLARTGVLYVSHSVPKCDILAFLEYDGYFRLGLPATISIVFPDIEIRCRDFCHLATNGVRNGNRYVDTPSYMEVNHGDSLTSTGKRLLSL